MKRFLKCLCSLVFASGASVGSAQSPISDQELVAPDISLAAGSLQFRVQYSVHGRRYQLQSSDALNEGVWRNVGKIWMGDGNPLLISTPHRFESPIQFYRLQLDPMYNAPEGFTLITEGSFLMGDEKGDSIYPEHGERPVHLVFTDAFYLQSNETTKSQWTEVYQWALVNGYEFDRPGDGKGDNHPVHSVNWYDTVKWCNARSEKEGLIPCYYTGAALTEIFKTGRSILNNETVKWKSGGYRLPTEAEWEKAARGGLPGKRFPWGDYISHADACYKSEANFYLPYDLGADLEWDPALNDGVLPYTAPAGSYAPNAYGLFDMAGGVSEWCWDSWMKGSGYYSISPDRNPLGPPPSLGPGIENNARMVRGGGWHHGAYIQRCSARGAYSPTYWTIGRGFRPARGL